MICDKCIKKTVCKLCDGSEIKGCIEFYRSHEEVLQEIRQDIDEWYQFPHSSLNWHCYTKLCEIFDKHINNRQFERIWQNTVEEMKRRKIGE